ncbi:AIPR family protein [Paraburkholderia adhaesiva]|uniref:AIPR family protein n=1 Tax=Paraburkholderia adhaesiva TaxID=2883244 RepID=UPI001F1D9E88|nr:AIPR family protein [Paraburkholderia adhaesiva]
MAKNDSLLIDGIIDDRVSQKLPSEKRDEAFEYFCIEEILKDWDLSQDELKSGWIDGRGDGGIDAFYVFVNGHPLLDAEQFMWPKAGAELVVSLITCKHHDSFKQVTIDALAATLPEFFDFSIESKDLKGAYSPDLIGQRTKLFFAYRRLAPRLNKMRIEVAYASRGDSNDIGVEVRARSEQIKKIITDSFAKCEASFNFIGSAELIDLNRKKPNFSLELPYVEVFSRGETYVLLANLSAYFRFISDNEGKLRRYLFDSNVRDFMGLNRVNEDIRDTLNNAASPDFWWLNNGVTILATAASVIGNSIHLEDIQIVNGLQTTESIFRHFNGASSVEDNRAVLVKVIVSRDDSVRDAIIRATNNQTDVEQVSLHATDRIQRDIEEVLHRSGIFYERRKNFYVNQGHSAGEIVTPLYIAAGYAALVLKLPHLAAGFRSKYIRSPQAYSAIFSDRSPLEVWPKIAKLLKHADRILETVRPRGGGSAERFLKSNRYLLCLVSVARHLGKFDFSAQDIAKLDVDAITDVAILDNWSRMAAFGSTRAAWSSKQSVASFCLKMETELGIQNSKRIENAPNLVSAAQKPYHKPTQRVDRDFANKVHALLPDQPWKPGIHKPICDKLGCTVSEYFGAVEQLIEEGLVNRQRDGVVYDSEGNVLMFDPDRVDPDTLQLKEA